MNLDVLLGNELIERVIKIAKNAGLAIMKIYNTKNYYVPEVYGGISETECSTMLKKFFQEKR